MLKFIYMSEIIYDRLVFYSMINSAKCHHRISLYSLLESIM